MRIPKVYNSELNNDEIVKHTIKLNIDPIPFYCLSDWQDDEKSYEKLIKDIERLVRSSYEYRNYVKFLKDEVNMNYCSFFNKITRDDVSIEIHHSPLTLFEITSIVFAKHVKEFGEENVNEFDVADEVTQLHYQGMVGLIPLSLTVHKLVHRGDVFIPIQCVYGKISSFYKKYKEYFTKEQKYLLKNIIMTSKQIDKENYRPSVLDRKFTYIEVDGLTLPTKIELSRDRSKIS